MKYNGIEYLFDIDKVTDIWISFADNIALNENKEISVNVMKANGKRKPISRDFPSGNKIVCILERVEDGLNYLNSYELKQDFTPIDLAKLMTEIQVELKSDKEIIKQNGFMTIEDTCCGSGGLLLEKANCLEKEGINPSLDLLVIANDIDPICAYMTYIQLYIYSIPGVVTVGNSLQLETRETFYTHRLLAIDLGIEKKDIEEKEIEE